MEYCCNTTGKCMEYFTTFISIAIINREKGNDSPYFHFVH